MEKRHWSGINGELLLHGGQRTWIPLRGETLIMVMNHFSSAVIDSLCTEDGWVTIIQMKPSRSLIGRNRAL